MKFIQTIAYVLLCLAFASTGLCVDEAVLITVDNANPPFMFQEKGEAQGLYPSLIQAVFQRLGSQAAINAYPWKRALAMGETAKAGIGGIYKNSERLKIFDYSDPIYVEKLLLYIRKGKNIEFQALTDLKGKNIGIIRGWSYGNEFDQARRAGLFTVEEVGNDDANFKKLLLDRVAGVIAIDLAAARLIQQNNYQTKIEALSRPVAVNETYLVFAKISQKTDLLVRFNTALAEMKRDGSYERIVTSFMKTEK